ncbi:biotin--[acetyl-CoA-carboxylase] ligase [Aquimarina sp. TRL1]|uniref:biotin--[acetyl-CoA-carboxylase] ligase n=1 Tax=Aquimarina sp. (strain TRL1) TaxID=2736252 RepID=UPI00158C73E0|nr:biotin--[acetyl-CoA-carboxylase] ligase [Aquimarina sp. TRL1]QKX03505.1 biotin--[acetyl-CoA-carboxylase] ligase [Aquimarina sp. TRL1]
MHIIKVDAIDSTNSFLRGLNREDKLVEKVCVLAREQTAGKGQLGASWVSNPGENLTCSVFMPIQKIEASDQFYISMLVSLSVFDALQTFMIPKLSIKWPNDILSDKYKICGILIENIVNNGRLTGVIIGVGINVNQKNFENLPRAASLSMLSGRNFNVEEVLHSFLYALEKRFTAFDVSGFMSLKQEYEKCLFRKNKPSMFKDREGDSFVGIIQSVTQQGKLQVLLEDEIIGEFDLKELQLLY